VISSVEVHTDVIFAFTLITQEFVSVMTLISGVRQFTVSVGGVTVPGSRTCRFIADLTVGAIT
jgi:hypothetical protein